MHAKIDVPESRLPTISVVVPSYNQGAFLERTLRSVLDQRYPRLELIVIDAGSTDGSLEIISRYRDRIAAWVSEPDGGHTRGLIKGFAHSTGDIQCWLNADDMHEPHTLAEVGAFFAAHPQARFLYGNSTWIDLDDRPVKYRREMKFYRWLWLYSHNYLPQPASFWRRDLYQQVGGLDPAFELAMDADLFVRFSHVCELHHVDRPFARFRYYPEQRNQRYRCDSDVEEHLIRCRELRRPVGRVETTLVGTVARAIRFSHRVTFR